MTERRGKVIVFKCDICKEEITHGRRMLKLFNTENRGSSAPVWDTCPTCDPKLIELMGKGRTIEPFKA